MNIKKFSNFKIKSIRIKKRLVAFSIVLSIILIIACMYVFPNVKPENDDVLLFEFHTDLFTVLIFINIKAENPLLLSGGMNAVS